MLSQVVPVLLSMVRSFFKHYLDTLIARSIGRWCLGKRDFKSKDTSSLFIILDK